MPRDDLGRFVAGLPAAILAGGQSRPTACGPGWRSLSPIGGRAARRAARQRRRDAVQAGGRRRTILDRHLGRPAIQADLTVRGGASADHLQALIEVARRRRDEPVMLDGPAVLEITPSLSDRK